MNHKTTYESHGIKNTILGPLIYKPQCSWKKNATSDKNYLKYSQFHFIIFQLETQTWRQHKPLSLGKLKFKHKSQRNFVCGQNRELRAREERVKVGNASARNFLTKPLFLPLPKLKTTLSYHPESTKPSHWRTILKNDLKVKNEIGVTQQVVPMFNSQWIAATWWPELLNTHGRMR